MKTTTGRCSRNRPSSRPPATGVRRFPEGGQAVYSRCRWLPQDEQNTQVFELWFSAGLGACDLQHITEETLADDRQPPLIRQSLESLKGEDRERHLSKFANALFTRLNGVKPSVKVRYLKGGFAIVGDHPQAHDARKVYDYYKDLVTELKLETKVDGGDVVGHEKPFGVFVNLRHTREIERESGGFGRYLQNQNNSGYYYYNFGRPLENYRDKFQEIVKQALQEQFEVVSVTFQDEKVNSRATTEYGWRVTPYAYLLLKARGPKVDKIAPLRLDLDFMDTSGYVILPVESPRDSCRRNPRRRRRPALREASDHPDPGRAAGEGWQADPRGQGNGPRASSPTSTRSSTSRHPASRLEKTDDQGLSVSKFDPESEANLVDSERTWLVHFRGAPDREPRLPRPSSSHRPRSTVPRWSTSAMSMPTSPRSAPRYCSSLATVSRLIPGPGGLAVDYCSRHWPSGRSSRSSAPGPNGSSQRGSRCPRRSPRSRCSVCSARSSITTVCPRPRCKS